MPVKRTAWACQYGCRRTVLTSKADMTRHERICFHNPEVRACASCENLFTEDEELATCEHHDISKKWRQRCSDYEAKGGEA